jgi:hypothetical protein
MAGTCQSQSIYLVGFSRTGLAKADVNNFSIEFFFPALKQRGNWRKPCLYSIQMHKAAGLF